MSGPDLPFSAQELRQCDRFLRGRLRDWSLYKRGFRTHKQNSEANSLLYHGRRVAAAVLINVLARSTEALEQAAKDGEAGYFAGRMHGQIQYLMWWVDGWYPAHENRAPSDIPQEDCPGIIRLRLRGFAKYFDKELSVDDPKLRRQLVLLNTPESLTCGYFAARGDFVKVLLVDDFEALFFLRPEAFGSGGEGPEQQEGQAGLWTPVGVVEESLPLWDCAVVRVHFLACTELVRVSNVHLIGIGHDEYQMSYDRITAARTAGLSIVEKALCQLAPQLIVRQACVLSGERCLASFWDHYTHLQLHLYNARLGRRLTLTVDDAICCALGLIVATEEIVEGQRGGIREMALGDKEALCHAFLNHVGVSRGALYVLDVQHPQPDIEPVLKHVRGTLLGVEVEVGFHGLDSQHIHVWVTHLIGPGEGEDKDAARTYHLQSLSLEQWRSLGFPDLDWLTEQDRERLCNGLLQRLRACQGYPVLALEHMDTLLLPQDFEPFNADKDYSRASTGLQGEVVCAGGIGHNAKQTNGADHDALAIHRPHGPKGSDGQAGLHLRYVRRLPAYVTTDAEGAGEGEGPDRVARLVGRERRLISAMLGHDGELVVSVQGRRGEGTQTLRLCCAHYHAWLRYGPLAWASSEQQRFLIELLCDRLLLTDGRLTFDPAPTLATRTHDRNGAPLPHPITVRDYGTHFRVLCGPREVRVASQDVLEAAGIGVRCLQWVGLPLRKHLAARLAFLTQAEAEGPLQVANGPMLVWKAFQRKVREGSGPLMVSVWDWGGKLEVVYRDYTGTLVDRGETSVERFHALVGRELWPSVMAADTRERALRHVIRHVGRYNRVSHFRRFRSLRTSDADDAARLAQLVFPKPKVLMSEHDVIAHIRRTRPDPSRLPPRDMDALVRVLFALNELDKMGKAGARAKRAEKPRVKPGARRIKSLYYREPPPALKVCECCSLEVHGPEHASTSCSHEFGLCRMCLILAQTRNLLARMPNLRSRVAEQLRKHRPSTDPPKFPPPEQRRRKAEVLRVMKVKREARDTALRSLQSPANHFYIGTELTLKPPKKPYKLTKSDKPHRHKHKSKSRSKGASKGETPSEDRLKTPMVAFLDHSIRVAAPPEPLTPHSIASTVSTKDWSMTMGNQTADQGDRLSGVEGREGLHAGGESLEFPPTRVLAKTGRPMASAAGEEDEDEEEEGDESEAESEAESEEEAAAAPSMEQVVAGSQTDGLSVAEVVSDVLSGLLDLVQARGDATAVEAPILAEARGLEVPVVGEEAMGALAEPVTELEPSHGRTVEVLHTLRTLFATIHPKDHTAHQEEAQEPPSEPTIADNVEEPLSLSGLTVQEARMALLGRSTTTATQAMATQGASTLAGTGALRELYMLLREEVFEVLDDAVLSVEARMPPAWHLQPQHFTLPREARMQAFWAIEDLLDRIDGTHAAQATTGSTLLSPWLGQGTKTALIAGEGGYASTARARWEGRQLHTKVLHTGMAESQAGEDAAGDRLAESAEPMHVGALEGEQPVDAECPAPPGVSVVRQRLSEHLALAQDFYPPAVTMDGAAAEGAAVQWNEGGQAQEWEGQAEATAQYAASGQGQWTEAEAGQYGSYTAQQAEAMAEREGYVQQGEGAPAQWQEGVEGVGQWEQWQGDGVVQQQGQGQDYGYAAQGDGAQVHYAEGEWQQGYDAQGYYQGEAQEGAQEGAANSYTDDYANGYGSAAGQENVGLEGEDAAAGEYGSGYAEGEWQAGYEPGSEAPVEAREAWPTEDAAQAAAVDGYNGYNGYSEAPVEGVAEGQEGQGEWATAPAEWAEGQPQTLGGEQQAWRLVEVEVVECNVCGREVDPQWEARVECLVCPDYDLCHTCHYYLQEGQMVTQDGHAADHPFTFFDPINTGQQAAQGDDEGQEGAYANAEGYAAQLGHEAQQAYEGQEGYDPQQVEVYGQEYDQQQGYTGQEAYVGQDGYTEQQAYSAQEGYDQQGYAAQEAYVGQEAYAAQAGYVGHEAYAAQGDYAAQEGYVGQEAYAAQEGYDQQPGYAYAEGYAAQEGYAVPEGYVGQEGYAYGEGYPAQEGYEGQQVYEGQQEYGEGYAYGQEYGGEQGAQ